MSTKITDLALEKSELEFDFKFKNTFITTN